MSQKKIEAILFAAGKEVTLERLAQLTDFTVEQVRSLLTDLQTYYEHEQRSFYLVERDAGWKLTVRDAYIPLVSALVSHTELDKPIIETLAIIAWKYPVVQSEIVKLRGAVAYDHMKTLESLGYVSKEREGRTYKLKLTKKFFDYFDLPSDQAKQAFLALIPEDLLTQAQEVDKEADEVERLIDLEKKEMEAKAEIKKEVAKHHPEQ